MQRLDDEKEKKKQDERSAGKTLTEKQRARLVDNTKHRPTSSIPAFVDARNYNVDALREMAKKREEQLEAMLELYTTIAFGVLNPVLAGELKALVNNIPASSPDWLYAACYGAQSDIGASYINSATTLGQKKMSDALTKSVENLFGTGKEESFVDGLKLVYSVSIQDVREKLESLDTKELLDIYFAYDARHDLFKGYRTKVAELIGKYRAQVMAVYRREFKVPRARIRGMGRQIQRSGVVVAYLDGKLALVHYGSAGRRFVEWVAPEMEKLALLEHRTIHGGAPRRPYKKSDLLPPLPHRD